MDMDEVIHLEWTSKSANTHTAAAQDKSKFILKKVVVVNHMPQRYNSIF